MLCEAVQGPLGPASCVLPVPSPRWVPFLELSSCVLPCSPGSSPGLCIWKAPGPTENLLPSFQFCTSYQQKLGGGVWGSLTTPQEAEGTLG